MQHIFRSYDIRGIYGRDLTDEIAERIGFALPKFVGGDIAIARDMRISSSAVMEKITQGIRRSGRSVYSLGLLPFGPGMFFAWKRGLPFVHVTASHLGKEWAGIKVFSSDGNSLIDTQIYQLRDAVLASASTKVDKTEAGKLDFIDNTSIISEYIDYLTKRLRAEKRLSVVIDCGNGMSGLLARKLFESAGFSASAMFEDLSSDFPNRSSEPTDESLFALKNAVNDGIGIAYDGDADRTVFVDEKKRVLKAEHLSALILEDITKSVKGPVIANVECTRTLEDAAKKFSLPVKRIRVGHPYLVSESKIAGAVLGVEDTGHFIIPSLLPFGDAIAVSLFAACALSKSSKRLCDIADSLPPLPSKKLKFECPDETKFSVVEGLKAKWMKIYRNISTTDGVRVDMPNGWALARASNTEPIVRLSMEALTERDLTEIEKTFVVSIEKEIAENG
jgi:phosphomannomutase